jgi:hypothetical protein
MATPNIFTGELFSLTAMTAAILKQPYTPTLLSGLNIFEESGVSTVDIWIEENNGVLNLLDVQPRGAPGAPVATGKRKGRPFRIPHIPQMGQVLADEVIGVRQFGTENQLQTLESKRDEKLAIARRNLDYTIESHRMAAILGQWIDANGDPQSLFNEFGVTEKSVVIPLAVDSTKTRAKALEVQESIEDGLGGIPYGDVIVLCGKTFWADFIENKEVRETYLNTPMAADLRSDPRTSVSFGGATWMRYRGTASVKIPDGEARAFPRGVPGMFLTRYAPGNIAEAVGTVGLPYYVTSEILEHGMGISFKAQSNPLNLCTRPNAIVKLTLA